MIRLPRGEEYIKELDGVSLTFYKEDDEEWEAEDRPDFDYDYFIKYGPIRVTLLVTHFIYDNRMAIESGGLARCAS